MKPETKTDELLTAGKLAKTLKRSHFGVSKALKRLKIEPLQIGGVNFYPAAHALDKLKRSMRKPTKAA